MKKLIAGILLLGVVSAHAVITTNVSRGIIFDNTTNAVSMWDGVITAGEAGQSSGSFAIADQAAGFPMQTLTSSNGTLTVTSTTSTNVISFRAEGIVGNNGNDYTNSLTTSFSSAAPQGTGQFSERFANSADFTVTTNGIFTCVFDGVVEGLADGSFSLTSAGSAVITGDWFIDGVDSSRGFIRDANNATFGSFAGSLGGSLTVTNGTTLEFKFKSDASDDIDIHNIQLKLVRIQ
jgi:hypothetical protein